MLRGTLELSRTYTALLPLLYGLPQEVKNPDVLSSKLAAGKAFRVDIPAEPARKYNAAIDGLKDSLKTAGSQDWMSFQTMMALFFIIRLSSVAVAWLYPSHILLAFVVGCLQFAVMPFSLVISTVQLIALSPALFAGYLLIYYPLELLCNAVFPAAVVEFFTLEVTNAFVGVFFIVDFIACAYCVFSTPGNGKSAPMPPRRLATSVVYGFLNCKTYFLVLLLHSRGLRIHGLVWLLDGMLGLSPKVAGWISKAGMHWAALFYHAHRIAHMPGVYEHAHKVGLLPFSPTFE